MRTRGCRPSGVAHRSVIRVALISLSVLLLFAGQSLAQTTTSQAATATAPTEAAQAEAAKLEAWLKVVNDPRNTHQARRTAAQAIIDSKNVETIAALGDLLAKATDATARLAICEAIPASNPPPVQLVDPLLAVLAEKDQKLIAAAGAALASYKNAGVADQLGELAKNNQAPKQQRLSAVEVLSLISDERRAIIILTTLVGDADATIRQKTFATLNRVAPIRHGQEAALWQEFGQKVAKMSELEWKALRLSLVLDELQTLRRDYEKLRSEHDSLVKLYVGMVRERYVQAPDAKKPAQLIALLQDPTAPVRVLAVELIRDMIADRKPIPDDVGSQLRAAMSDASPVVRRNVALVLRDLRDPADAKRVLAVLPTETDLQAKEAMINALGALGDVTAIGPLIPHLADANELIAAEAAAALGKLAAKGSAPPEALQPAIKPLVPALIDRFKKLPADGKILRERLLAAMAMIADPQFTDVFIEHADSETAELRHSAVRGLGALGDPKHLNLLIARLTTDADARIRQAAATAVGGLASADEHLEVLFGRINPQSEADEAVRAAAWDAFVNVIGSRAGADQLRWAVRCDSKANPGLAERFVAFMTDIDKKMAGANSAPPELAVVRERLGDFHVGRAAHAEAARLFLGAFEQLANAKDARAGEVGLKLLRAQMKADRCEQAVGTAAQLQQLASPAVEQAAGLILDRLNQHVAAEQFDKALGLIAQLSKQVPDCFGGAWASKFGAIAEQATKLQDAKNVPAWVAQLTTPGEPGKNAAQNLIAMGDRAVPLLAEELRKLISAEKPDASLEKAVIDVLGKLAPTWKPYEPGAPRDAKLQAIQSLTAASQPTTTKAAG